MIRMRLKTDSAPAMLAFENVPAELHVHCTCSARGCGIIIAGFDLPNPVENATDIVAAAYMSPDEARFAYDDFVDTSYSNLKYAGMLTVSGRVDFTLVDRTLVPRLKFTPEDGNPRLALDCEFGIAMRADSATLQDMTELTDRFADIAQAMLTYTPYTED